MCVCMRECGLERASERRDCESERGEREERVCVREVRGERESVRERRESV